MQSTATKALPSLQFILLQSHRLHIPARNESIDYRQTNIPSSVKASFKIPTNRVCFSANCVSPSQTHRILRLFLNYFSHGPLSEHRLGGLLESPILSHHLIKETTWWRDIDSRGFSTFGNLEVNMHVPRGSRIRIASWLPTWTSCRIITELKLPIIL